METLSAIIQDLLIFVGACTFILIGLIAAIFMASKNGALRAKLSSIAARVAVTLGAGALAIPIEPIPGIDAIYDIAAPLLVLYYWYTLFRRHTKPRDEVVRSRL